LEETMSALAQVVKQGKALYVGISNYDSEQAAKASSILENMGTPCIINQVKYSMFERWPENSLLQFAEDAQMGIMAFSPLAQGLLTNKYLNGIPENSRAAKDWGFLKPGEVEPALEKIKLLDTIAATRGQTLAQMALAWLLKDKRVTSVLVGASSVAQLSDNIKSLDNKYFTVNEMSSIEVILKS
jgi:L-glyceraldehyde 3-phosphate reductase